ncbi:MAG: DUF3857 domain-containing transglutaminase family protein [Limisphaerales bacterium]
MLRKRRIAELMGWVVLLALGLDRAQCHGQEARPDAAPPANWVIPIPFDPQARLQPVDPSEHLRWILKDCQINAQNNEIFNHEVRQILKPSGVNQGSLISIDYDPGYQLLTFHWVTIWRGTTPLNRLDLNSVEVGQRAPDAEKFLFSAKKSAVLVLDDVRVGDVIDYAYSLQGDNPVLASRFSDKVQLQANHPIDRLTTRLLWPQGRSLYVQNHRTDLKYSAARKGAVTEFVWTVANVPGWREEPSLPIWYQPYPWVQLSEFQKWSDVNRLVLDLFTNTGPLSPELTRQINEWKSLPDAEDRALAALRFVQDDVRTLENDSAGSGYKPAAPSAVFDRRSGDSKDKSLLLITMLRALGIDAWPTLVNTRLRQSVVNLHPSPTVFDHVVVLVNPGGQNYWLDATGRYQRGSLAFRSWPDYGYGLVVHPGATTLAVIAPCPVLPMTTVTEYLHLGVLKQDTGAAAVVGSAVTQGLVSELKVVTVAQGPDADQLREKFATTTRDEIEKDALHALVNLYPEIDQTAPLIYTDDERRNQIEVDGFYSVRNIWKPVPKQLLSQCWVYPWNVKAAIKPPANVGRTMPVDVPYPVHEIFRAIFTVPVLALIAPDEQTIQNPAFYFHRTVAMTQVNISLEYEYRSLTDAVSPEAFPTYLRQLDAAAQLTDYAIVSY